MYKQRSYVTKLFILSTIFTGTIFSFSLANLLNVKNSVILFDKLGEEFEVSRVTKENLFNKRKDLTAIEKAEIYKKMNSKN